MRFPPSEEVRVLRQLAEHPDDHLTLPDDAYTSTGAILITRQNRRTSLHRWLHTTLTGEILDGQFFLRICDEPRCVNPRHYTVHDAPRLPEPERAISLGPPKPTRGQILAARTQCPNGHEYTPENTYIHTQRDGYRRRFCRTCRRQRRPRRTA